MSEPTPSEATEEVAGQVITPDAELAPEAIERRDAALALVRKFGDPALRSEAVPVTEFDTALAAEAERMIGIMRDGMGVGLAATQLGVMHRLLVFRASPDAEATALANPRIEWTSDDLVTAEEGCLSLPGIVVDVERPQHARVTAFDLEGGPVMIEASGLEARILQHETDHLHGVLILDRTSKEQRRGAMRALREGGAYAPPVEDDENTAGEPAPSAA